MKSPTANLLIIVGGCLIVAPLVFLYFSYRLAAHAFSVALAHGKQWDKVTVYPLPPEYYVPACLIFGVLCIGVGALLSRQAEFGGAQPETLRLGLD